MKLAGFVALLLLFGVESAYPVTFDITGATVAPGNPTTNELVVQALEAAVNRGLFPSGSEDDFLRQMGNANALSTRGLETDPVSHPRYLVVSSALSLALTAPPKDSQVQGAGAQKNKLTDRGVAGQASFMVGAPARSLGIEGNLFGLEADRLEFFANFMNVNIDQTFEKVKLGATNLGVGANYVLMPGKDQAVKVFRWTGWLLSTGLQYSRTSVTYFTEFDMQTSDSGVSMAWNAAGDIATYSHVVTIPVQVTTGITILKVLTVYPGLGLDFNFGSSRLEGVVTGAVRGTNGSGTTVYQGTGTLDAGASNRVSPKFGSLRFILGMQLNLWAFKIFSQASLNSPTGFGAVIGARLAF